MSKIPDFKMREDKLSPYLEALLKDFFFDEFSDDYLKAKKLHFLKGVAVPFKISDMTAAKEGRFDVSQLVDNMAMVIGSNTKFPYKAQYIRYMASFFNEKLIGVFTSRGAEELMNHNVRTAVAYYRMALMLAGDDCLAVFGYACALREWYLSLEDSDETELISILKAESTEYFEWNVIEHPEFAPTYYYLGFAYLNNAMYGKAQFIWTRFVELSEDKEKKEVKEIEERLLQLVDPVNIEAGINKLTVGDLESGLKILEPYTDSEYKDWWPLHYYLACTYRELEQPDEAIEGFKKVLKLNASNYDACKALSEIYDELGDKEKALKYSKKCEILLANQQS